jgi:transposase
MSKIRRVLQLLHEAALSQREAARAAGVSKSCVSDIASRARAAGLSWAQARELDDEALHERLHPPPVARSARHLEPDWAHLHQQLKRPGVTLQLLWEEYQLAHSGQAYKYSAFCEKYARFARSLKRSMRQVHTAGERLFVDYAGQTVPMVDVFTGEITQAQIFVAVLGASNYTYACATPTQQAGDWVRSIIATLEYIGGVPRLLVPDQPRALIARPDRYEPTTHRLLAELGDHYGVAILPARPAHPQDKAKVEVGVQVVERWILARLRERRFIHLGEVNRAIAPLLAQLNERPFKKLPGSRRSTFEQIEHAALSPLPAARMQVAQFKLARASIDYHIEYQGHYYSVPHRLVGQQVELRITDQTLEVLHKTQRVAAHVLSTRRGAHTTTAEHMPASHREHAQWSPAKLLAWGERVGAACASVVRWQMEHRPHPEQGYRSCLGLMRLGREYGTERLEAACARALSIRAPNYRSVSSILASGLDRHGAPASSTESPAMPVHENVRGPGYYH